MSFVLGACVEQGPEWPRDSYPLGEMRLREVWPPFASPTANERQGRDEPRPVMSRSVLTTPCDTVSHAVDVTGDVGTTLHRNLECQVHASRQIASGQTGDAKSEHQHLRNQGTKMDWNA